MIIKRITWQISILIIFFLVLIFLPNPLSQNIKEFLIIPFEYPLIFTSKSSSSLVDFLQHKSIKQRNEELEKKIDTLKRKLTDLKETQLENKRFRKLFNFKQQHAYKTVVAEVIAKDSSNWIQTIIINKGKKDNLKEGTVVMSYSGLVGRIIETGSTTSKVILITDPSLKVAARVQRTRDQGVTEGMYRDLCRIKYLSLESKILEGDKIITSGLSQNFPEGILIGNIIDIDEDPSFLYKIATIEPEVDLQKLEEVICIEKRK